MIFHIQETFEIEQKYHNLVVELGDGFHLRIESNPANWQPKELAVFGFRIYRAMSTVIASMDMSSGACLYSRSIDFHQAIARRAGEVLDQAFSGFLVSMVVANETKEAMGCEVAAQVVGARKCARLG